MQFSAQILVGGAGLLNKGDLSMLPQIHIATKLSPNKYEHFINTQVRRTKRKYRVMGMLFFCLTGD